MNGATTQWDAEARKRVFDRFYELPAREIMDTSFAHTAFVSPHCSVVESLEIFLKVDHAWVLGDPTTGREVTNIILRRDLLRTLEPTSASYSRFKRARFKSLAHGSADCTCCFTEGRVLHPIPPEMKCREIFHLMESKEALYLPVVEGGELVGEIGSIHLLLAIRRIQTGQPRPS
jgi:predicted transcriptional regulator